MTSLSHLRAGLARLRRRRRAVRLSEAGAIAATAGLWILAGLFVLDWQLRLTSAQRVLAIAGVMAIWLTVFRSRVLPLLMRRESELEIALLVERELGIEGDLVAALQFESADAQRWGSVQLERAVVEYVADSSRSLDLNAQRHDPWPAGRLARLGLMALVVGSAAAAYPEFARVFIQRLALGRQHYPTATRIEQLSINGRAVTLGDAGGETVRCAAGSELRMEAVGGGELPPGGLVRLKSAGAEREIELAEGAEAGSGTRTYWAALPPLTEALTYEVFLGDAWIESSAIEPIPWPEIESAVRITPPAYARGKWDGGASGGDRYGSAGGALAGSRVELEVVCRNKPLTAVRATMGGKEFALVSNGTDGRRWSLPAVGTPLERLKEAVKYTVQVVDGDGLGLNRPHEGLVRLEADRPPTVVAEVVAPLWLPTATPVIGYKAEDDFGLAELRLAIEIVRQEGERSEDGVGRGDQQGRVDQDSILLADYRALAVAAGGGGPAKEQGEYPLRLEKYKLAKGDQVRARLVAVDDRGEEAGQAATGDPVVLNITDEAGVFAASAELDERSARQLDAILKLQSGSGP